MTAFRGPALYIRYNLLPGEILADLAQFRERYGTKVAGSLYGVALMNNGRYGHRVKKAVIGLTLLRDPKQGPDAQPEDAGEGRHVLTYVLYPHAGDWRKAEVLKRAWELNAPPMARLLESGGAAEVADQMDVLRLQEAAAWGLVRVEPAHVVLK